MKMLRLVVFTSLLLGSSATAEPLRAERAAPLPPDVAASLLAALPAPVSCDAIPDSLCKQARFLAERGHLKTACLLHWDGVRKAWFMWYRARPKEMTEAAWLDAVRVLPDMIASLAIICQMVSDGDESK